MDDIDDRPAGAGKTIEKTWDELKKAERGSPALTLVTDDDDDEDFRTDAEDDAESPLLSDEAREHSEFYGTTFGEQPAIDDGAEITDLEREEDIGTLDRLP